MAAQAENTAFDYTAIFNELQRVKFNPDVSYTPEKLYFTIENDSTIIGTSGNLVAFSGLPKAGKSTFISFLIASWLSQTYINGFKLHQQRDKNKIVLFDTEQTPGSITQKVSYIKKNARRDDLDNLDIYLLREYSPKSILKGITAYLRNEPRAGVVIIDGLLDLVENMNDEVTCKRMVRYLKKLAGQHDCLIIGIIHLSKKEKLSLGHLGSSVDRAAQSVIEIEKTKEGNLKASGKLLRDASKFYDIEVYFNHNVNNFVPVN